MGNIEEIYAELDADVSEEEFREAVEEKVEQMGGLADEETAAMLIAHDLDGGEVETIADIEAGLEEAKFVGKVTSVGDLRTFERDDAESEGHVINLDLADESGSVRVALWDDDAVAAADELEVGDVLRVKGRPKEGYRGLEVSADRVEADEDVEIEVDVSGEATAASLTLGQSDVNLRGVVLDTGSVRTFERDDGTEGRVANLTLGDETGRVRVTLWDDRADRAEELSAGQSVEVVDGYVRERDGSLELHVGARGAVDELEETVEFVPEATDIDGVEIGQTVDIAGVVRSADPKRTFDRDDGSEGQVRNIRVQDQTGDIRVALWGEKADVDLGAGDEVFCADVEVQEGWQDDLEASAGWRSTVIVIDGPGAEPDHAEGTAGLDEFAGESTSASDSESSAGAADDDGGDGGGRSGGGGRDRTRSGGGQVSIDEVAESDAGADGTDAVGAEIEAEAGADDADETADAAGDGASDEPETFTGTVVQPGDPVILDDGEETLHVETDADVHLGQEVTVRGRREGEQFVADDVF